MVLYKSRFIQLIIIIATVFITAIVFLQACSERKIKYVLIIDNSVVNTDSVYFQKNCFRLPLVCILKEIGIDICWSDNNNAEFQWNNDRYLLSLRDKKLIRENEEFNLITPPPGNSLFICEVDYSEREIIIDDGTLHGVLQLLGIRAYFSDDRENSIFRIEIIDMPPKTVPVAKTLCQKCRR